MEINVAVVQLLNLCPSRIKLQVMFLGEPDGAVCLMSRGAYTLVGSAHPGFRHRHLTLGRNTFRYLPGGLVGNDTTAFHVGGHIGAVVLHPGSCLWDARTGSVL